MASELSVKGKKEFEELIRALEWSNEFGIYFAIINPPLIRKQAAEELKRSLEIKGIKVHYLELNSSYFDLLSIIPEKVPSYCLRGAETEIRPALFIFGAEEAIASDAETRRLFFDCLNWQRDKLRETIACPLIIWLPEFALRILALEAPDFWAWRSGVYYLEPEPIWILKDTKELLERGTSEYDVLTYQEKIRRLQQFKALLEDYEKQPFGEELESELLGIQFNLLQEAGKLSLSLANYEDAKQYFLQGLKIAERLKDKELLASIFSKLTLVLLYQGDYISAEEYSEKIVGIAQERRNKNEVAHSFGILGWIALIQNNHHKAEEFFKKSLEIGKKLKDKKLIVYALRALGRSAKEQGKYTKARSFLEQSLKISEEIGEKGGRVDILFDLSELGKSQGNIDEAVHKIEEAQALSEEIKDHGRIAEVLEKQGSLAEAQGDYQHARKYYEESLEIYEHLGDKINVALTYLYLGGIAKDSGNYEEAERCIKDSLKILEEVGSEHLIATSQAFLGNLYLETEDFSKAERSFLDALESYESLGNAEMINAVRQGLEQARQGKLGKNKLYEKNKNQLEY
jgi:tetratricopeptide (TPR) repeat protein